MLGAIYTSEFLHFRVRAKVKPVIEVMASLPSVVLGFVAALVIAPVVETWMSAVVLGFGLLPLLLISILVVYREFLSMVPVAAPKRTGTQNSIALRLRSPPAF